TDAGTTWTRTSVPLPANFSQAAGSPTVRFGDDGRVYVSFMAATFLGKTSTGASPKPPLIYDTGSQTIDGRTVLNRALGMQANNGIFVASSADGLTWNASDVAAVSSQRYDQLFTTSPAAVAVGAATVTPAAMPPNNILPNIVRGMVLIIDEGLPTQERVTVTAATANTFTATFAKAHAANFSIHTPVYFDTTPDIAVDTNPDSPHYGKLYATWIRFYPQG